MLTRNLTGATSAQYRKFAPRKPIGTKQLYCALLLVTSHLIILQSGRLLMKKTKKTLAMEADLLEVGYEVAMANAKYNYPCYFTVSLLH
jgi:hypothetical protein